MSVKDNLLPDNQLRKRAVRISRQPFCINGWHSDIYPPRLKRSAGRRRAKVVRRGNYCAFS